MALAPLSGQKPEAVKVVFKARKEKTSGDSLRTKTGGNGAISSCPSYTLAGTSSAPRLSNDTRMPPLTAGHIHSIL